MIFALVRLAVAVESGIPYDQAQVPMPVWAAQLLQGREVSAKEVFRRVEITLTIQMRLMADQSVKVWLQPRTLQTLLLQLVKPIASPA